MEYVPGTTLHALMRALPGHRLAPEPALYVARSVCRALAHAHELSGHCGEPLCVVHRDVTPQKPITNNT